jgi:branched-chain amino acid transport system ATP-binding protein
MFMGLAEAEAKTGSADGRAEPRESALLADDGVRMRFGGVTALEDVSFDVYQGAICGLIGPNGAGKTTLFNCISRLCDPHAGSIFFDRRPLASFSIHEIASLGFARTFQNVALFATMTTRDNVRVGAHALARGGFLANALALPLAGREERRVAERADALIDEFGLQRVADVPVGQLTFGVRARARDRSEAVSARRAGGRPQSRGGRCARRRNPRHSRSAPRRDPVGRTSHEPRHAHL